MNIKPPSVIATLRDLVPTRDLERHETLHIAHLQANRLRDYFDSATTPAPDELVTELPCLIVIRRGNLPVSGSAHWNGHHWIITLNDDDHPLRQLFSMMHEFKHILDHTTQQTLYRDSRWVSTTACTGPTATA